MCKVEPFVHVKSVEVMSPPIEVVQKLGEERLVRCCPLHLNVVQIAKSLAIYLTLLQNSDEDRRLNKNECAESEESVDVIDNIPVNTDIYVARNGT
ncbi:hypothetical protein TNCV_2086631 [Trichonephila clavipes]|nr:hypothetical protein TNCV_2086631 [Trichonephila clavipes]